MTGTVKAGTTSVSVVIRIIDDTVGTTEEGVEHNTAGLSLWYRRDVDPGSTPLDKVTITAASRTGLTQAWADGGIEHIDDGYYRLDVADAAFATGARGVMIGGTVTDMIIIGTYVTLVDYDPQDAVRLGLTALPNAAADAAGGLAISDAGGLDIDTMNSNVSAILTDTGTTLDNLVDDLETRLGTPSDLGSGASIAANLVDIEGQTDDIGAAGAGLTGVPWNAAWDAEVQSEVTDALNAYDPPTKAELDSGFAALNNVSTADVNAQCDTALSDIGLDHLVSAAVIGTDVTDNSIVARLVSKSATADWDSYNNTTDSLEAIQDDITTVDTVVDGIQTDLDNGTDGLGAIKTDTAAILVDTADMQPKLGTPAADLSADVAAVKVDTAATLVDTNELQGDWANGGRLDLLVDQIITDIAALNDISTADVNAQVLDVINTDTFAELGAVPAATSTLADKINWVFMLARNKVTQTSTTTTVRNDADSGDVATSTVSDNGTTATRGEFS